MMSLGQRLGCGISGFHRVLVEYKLRVHGFLSASEHTLLEYRLSTERRPELSAQPVNAHPMACFATCHGYLMDQSTTAKGAV